MDAYGEGVSELGGIARGDGRELIADIDQANYLVAHSDHQHVDVGLAQNLAHAVEII
jgi:hypothetical protein